MSACGGRGGVQLSSFKVDWQKSSQDDSFHAGCSGLYPAG